jgi:hypothetical protein
MLQRLIVKWVIGSGIYEAAETGDLSRVRALLAVDPELAKRRDRKHSRTLLHLAAARGNIPLAELLLIHGAEIDAVDPATGRTPLHLAALQGYSQLVRFLLARGANRHAIDAGGHTPLEVAKMAQKRATAELLMQDTNESVQD